MRVLLDITAVMGLGKKQQSNSPALWTKERERGWQAADGIGKEMCSLYSITCYFFLHGRTFAVHAQSSWW